MEEVNKKLKVGEVRKEIGNLKKGLFKNVAVMRSDDLRAYLDDLRYAENVISARQATGKAGPTEDKTEKEDGMIYEKPKKKETKIDTESSSDEETKSVGEEKKVVKKVAKQIKEVEKEIKKEKPKTMKESHKKEVKKLDEIPKELKKMVRDHMKLHPDHSEKKALGVVKKNLLKVLS